MQLSPLTPGRILRRYKRFLADVELSNGEIVTAHCPNTGSMVGCWEPGAPVQLSRSDNPKRKLPWTLERVDMGRGWVGVNTHLANPVVAEGVAADAVAELAGYASLRREVKSPLPGTEVSRLDILLESGPGPDAWVEVKNVTLLLGDRVGFPDAPSARARKHLEALAALVAAGRRGVIFYAVNRPEGACFAPAAEIDPAYAETLRRVIGQGVEALAYRIRHTATGMELGERIPLA